MSLDTIDYWELTSLNKNTSKMVDILQQNDQNGVLAQELSGLLSQANEESRQLRAALSNERASRRKVIDDYNGLVGRYNGLKDEYNVLADRYNALKDKYNGLVGEYNSLAKDHKELKAAYLRLKERK